MSTEGHFDVEKSGCRMSGEVVRTDGSLEIRFSFNNRTAQTAFLFDGVYRDQGPEIDTSVNLIYVEPSGQDVILGKKLIRVPEGMLVEKKVVPLMTRVSPGAHVDRKYSIALPLLPWTPYLPDDPRRPEMLQSLQESANGYFELGFLLTPPEGAALAQRVNLTERELWRFDTVNPDRQSIMRVGPISGLAVKVR